MLCASVKKYFTKKVFLKKNKNKIYKIKKLSTFFYKKILRVSEM